MNRESIGLSALTIVFLFSIFSSSFLLLSCKAITTLLIELHTPEYRVSEDSHSQEPLFLGKDATRTRIAIKLREVAATCPEITDIQFVPRRYPWIMVVLCKGGDIHLLEMTPEGFAGKRKLWLHFPVLTASEEGLLGLTFHPRFPQDPRLFLNLVTEVSGEDTSQILELTLDSGDLFSARIVAQRILLEVVQPYPNHNAGQLAFGPDGYLYIGWGDGGWRGDPHNNAQNPQTFLGKMLRLDVDRSSEGRPYAIPPDNPFVEDRRYLPEIFALGFRNPWRYSFDRRGRLIVADVGQDAWEEIDVVEQGKNYGWKIQEGYHCFSPKKNCPSQGLIPPIYEYGHDEGQSITGGYVYYGEMIKELQGLYVFGDFVQGKIWAIPIPEDFSMPVTEVYALGKWPVLISTFGQDPRGEIYLGDYASGKVYRLLPKSVE